MPRVKEFDPAVVVDKATTLFWMKGYRNTSMRDLIDGTGVNQYGLYSEFNDKRGLFIQALENYEKKVTQEFLTALHAEGPFDRAFADALELLLEILVSLDALPGCLLTNTAVEFGEEDREIHSKLQDNFKLMRSHIETRLRAAANKGEQFALPDLTQAADLLTTMVYSVGVQLRQGFPPETILGRASVLSSLICGSRKDPPCI